MSEAFPNPYDPPGPTPPAPSANVDAEDEQLSRALRESLALEEAEKQRRWAEEQAELEAAIRASERDHAQQQRAWAEHQKKEKEILVQSKQEAYRDQRRREAERQRHALLEMEIMEQSRREHEAHMRAYTPSLRDSASDTGAHLDMESLLWLQHCGSVSASSSGGRSQAASVPAAAAAAAAEWDAPPQYESVMPNPYTDSEPPAPATIPAPLPTETEAAADAPRTSPARAAAPGPTSVSTPTDDATTPQARAPLTRYEQMFGRYEEDDDGGDEWDASSSSSSSHASANARNETVSAPSDEPLAAPPKYECAIRSTATSSPTQQPTSASVESHSAAPTRRPPPAAPSMASTPASVPVAPTSPAAPEAAVAAVADESAARPYPPEYQDGQPALRGVQFGTAMHPYALELGTPQGVALYPALDLAMAPHTPSAMDSVYFPHTIDLDQGRPYFVLRAYSWKVLLQAMAWHGNARVCSARGRLYMHVAMMIPHRADLAPFAAPCMVMLALSAQPTSITQAPALQAYVTKRHASVTLISLVPHPLALPTDLVTLAQSLFSAPQLSTAPALRDLRQLIARQEEWLEARRHAIQAQATSDEGSVLEQRFLRHQLSLLQHPVLPPDAVDVDGAHREHLRDRVRRTFARWNSAPVASDDDLTAWITPYPLDATS